MLSAKELAMFSLARAVSQAGNGGLRPSLEREVLQEATERAGRQFTPNQFVVPWVVLKRDMTAAGASGSAYLVGQDQEDAADVLREASLVARLGASMLPGLVGDTVIPRATAAVSGEWLSTELDPVTAEQPTLGQIALRPKNAVALVTMTEQAARQAPDADQFVSRHLAGSIGYLLDQAAIAGTGSNGQPLGVLNTAGIETLTGADFAFADALEGKRKLRANRATPSGWIAPPATVETLEGRDAGTDTAVRLWQADRMADVPAYASTAVPAATVLLGDWQHLLIATWGAGVELVVDPFGGFNSGKISIRAWLACDVAIRHPGAFAAATSVS